MRSYDDLQKHCLYDVLFAITGKGFSYISVAWSLGTMIAPLIGGLLCNPADKFPTVFSEDGIFGRLPYLLPCLIAAIFNLCTSLLCYLCMQETRRAILSPSTSSSKSSTNIEMTPLTSSNTKYQPIQSRDLDQDSACVVDEEKAVNVSKECFEIGGDEDDHAVDEAHAVNPLLVDGSSKAYTAIRTADAPIRAVISDIESIPTAVVDTETTKPSVSSVLRQPIVLMTTGSYGILAMAYIVYDETIPLFLKLDTKEGGLSFNSAEIGTLISLSGAIMLLFTTFFLPKIASR